MGSCASAAPAELRCSGCSIPRTVPLAVTKGISLGPRHHIQGELRRLRRVWLLRTALFAATPRDGRPVQRAMTRNVQSRSTTRRSL